MQLFLQFKALLLKFSVYALICIGIWLSGYALGGYHCRNANEAKQAKATNEVIGKVNKANEEGLQIALKVEKKNQESEVQYRYITKEILREIEKPVYRDCVIDANGVRLWNAANSGTTEANTASKPTR